MPMGESAAAMLDDLPDDTTVHAISDWQDYWADPSMETARWMLACWVFAGQVLPQHVVSAHRAMRRRAARLHISSGPTGVTCT